MMRFGTGLLAATFVTTALTYTFTSRADTTVVTPQPAAPVATPVVATPVVAAPVAERSTYSGPNRGLLATGLITFGGAYIPSVIVAGASSLDADHHLYVPVVGPWLDLADRPGCGPASTSCDTETTNKVLLVLSGAFQGIGALTTLAAFLAPEHGTPIVASDEKPSVHFSPASIGANGYGLAALGKF